MPSVALTCLFVLVAVTPSGSQPKVVRFVDGQTSVDSEGNVDHVIVRDAKGNLMSESWCDSGRFSDYFALFRKFRDAVSGGDRDAALKLVAYPFRVNGGTKPMIFKTAASLSKSYATIFTPEVQQKIRKAEPAAVFCRNGQAMVGEGVIWASHTGIAVLNR